MKTDRLKNIQDKFTFTELDLSNESTLRNFFEKNSFDIVLHFAAQPGVRYSIENPKSYISNNILGTFNLLENLKNKKLDHLLLASTSSVYGNNFTKEGIKESDNSDFPISLYSSTKKSIESIAHSYSYNFNLPITIFRFFTVYGPWGRPDMALYKFVNSITSNTPLDVFNKGEMWRDFTYIDDLIQSITKLMEIIPTKSDYLKIKESGLSPVAPYRIINIGNQKSIKIDDFINTLEKVIGKKAIRNNLPIQKGDVDFTLSNCDLLYKLTGFVPSTPLEKGIKLFYNWYKDYYNLDKKTF